MNFTLKAILRPALLGIVAITTYQSIAKERGLTSKTYSVAIDRYAVVGLINKLCPGELDKNAAIKHNQVSGGSLESVHIAYWDDTLDLHSVSFVYGYSERLRVSAEFKCNGFRGQDQKSIEDNLIFYKPTVE